MREVGRSVIVFSLLPLAAARAGLPRSRKQQNAATRDQSLFSPCCHLRQRARGSPRLRKPQNAATRDQSLFSPCCHLRRCRPNHETMIAASRNGIIALEIAAPSPSCPAMMARWYDKVAIKWVALTGPPRVIAQINWKSVNVNRTENVITTAMIGVSKG